MMFTYLAALMISLCGLAIIDYRLKLAFWHDAKRSAKTIVIAVGVFITWDLLGIGLGIFIHGSSQLALPFEILPEFPIEEILFLVLLCYTTLLLYRGAERVCSRT